MAAGKKGIKIRVAAACRAPMSRVGNYRRPRALHDVACADRLRLRGLPDHTARRLQGLIFKGEHGPGETTNGLLSAPLRNVRRLSQST
jgi:hypothetical protein